MTNTAKRGHEPDFEAYLIDRHAEQYAGTDDLMCEACDEWMADLGIDEVIAYANAWAAKITENNPRPLGRG